MISRRISRERLDHLLEFYEVAGSRVHEAEALMDLAAGEIKRAGLGDEWFARESRRMTDHLSALHAALARGCDRLREVPCDD